MKTKLSRSQIELIQSIQDGNELILYQPKLIGLAQFYLKTSTGSMSKINWTTADVLRRTNMVKVLDKITESTRFKYIYELTELGKSKK